MTKKSGYLHRLRSKRERAALKKQILFGIVLGWLLALLGMFHLWFLPGAYAWCWDILMKLGLLLLGLGVVLPSLLAIPELFFSRITQPIGKIIFSVILTICYFLLVFPIGLLVQKLKGTDPFYSWHQHSEMNLGGWIPIAEQVSSLQSVHRRQKRSLIQQFFWVLAFFIRQRNYFLLPLLIVLLTFGLLMFFVQATGIAPLIYTLF